MNIESSTLVLRTANATTINATRTTATWRINLRACLGNLYNKYNRFKICLTSWGTGVAVNGFTSDDVTTFVSMSGLQWENQTYDVVTNGLTQNAAISSLRFTNNGVALENFTGEVGQVFRKPNFDELQVTINIQKISGAALPALAYPQCCYVFSIYGVPDDEKHEVIKSKK
ncbi:MAG: hypothetical protein ACOVOV_00920 [Dolichospermum sp.]